MLVSFHPLIPLYLSRYAPSDVTDLHAHLTNTARGAELADFDESKYVQVRIDMCINCKYIWYIYVVYDVV